VARSTERVQLSLNRRWAGCTKNPLCRTEYIVHDLWAEQAGCSTFLVPRWHSALMLQGGSLLCDDRKDLDNPCCQSAFFVIEMPTLSASRRRSQTENFRRPHRRRQRQYLVRSRSWPNRDTRCADAQLLRQLRRKPPPPASEVPHSDTMTRRLTLAPFTETRLHGSIKVATTITISALISSQPLPVAPGSAGSTRCQ
jgi:hypothetical protein